MAQDRVQWSALVLAVLNLRAPLLLINSTNMATCEFVRWKQH